MKLQYILIAFGIFSTGGFKMSQVALAGMHDAACPGALKVTDWKKESLQILEGRIKDVMIDSSCMGQGEFLSLQVTVGQKDYLVRLGPVTFINSKKLGIALGESIRIKGHAIDGTDEASFIATEVEIKGKKIRLRDDDSQPMWSKRSKAGVS